MITQEQLHEIAKENKVDIDCLWIRPIEVITFSDIKKEITQVCALTDFYMDTIDSSKNHFESDVICYIVNGKMLYIPKNGKIITDMSFDMFSLLNKSLNYKSSSKNTIQFHLVKRIKRKFTIKQKGITKKQSKKRHVIKNHIKKFFFKKLN